MFTYSKSAMFKHDESVVLRVAGWHDYYENEHVHEFVELVYTMSGTIQHRIDDKVYEAKPNSLLFITPGQVHSITSEGDSKFLNILIKPEFISEYAVDGDTFYNLFRFFLSDPNDKLSTESQIVWFKGKEAYEVKNVIDFMLDTMGKTEPVYTMILNSYTRVVLSKMFKVLNEKNPDKNYPKSLFFDMMDSILDYINKNYSEPITLSTLATRCYFNPSYISREFKKISGKGFKEYLTEIRITEAAKYLTQTELSIDEIQAKVGISNKTRFFKEFSNIYGCTPQEYKITQKKAQNNNN